MTSEAYVLGIKNGHAENVTGQEALGTSVHGQDMECVCTCFAVDFRVEMRVVVCIRDAEWLR
jgi:hypothetical protein